MKKILLPLIAVMLSLTSCTKYAYYQSPLHNNTNIYREVPMYRDTISSAFYASATFSATNVNKGQDHYSTFHGSIHRSHKFSQYQAYYGLTGGIGHYKVGAINQANPDSTGTFSLRYYNRALNDSLISANSGYKMFGSYSAVGGINFVHPWPHGEWRVLGVGLALNKEFGKYLEFRNKLPDTAANLIDRNRTTLTICLSTDFVAKTRQGSSGYQFAYIFNPKRLPGFDAARYAKSYQSAYMTHTLHINIQKVTGYFQLSMGTFSTGMQLGANYRLGK